MLFSFGFDLNAWYTYRVTQKLYLKKVVIVLTYTHFTFFSKVDKSPIPELSVFIGSKPLRRTNIQSNFDENV